MSIFNLLQEPVIGMYSISQEVLTLRIQSTHFFERISKILFINEC